MVFQIVLSNPIIPSLVNIPTIRKHFPFSLCIYFFNLHNYIHSVYMDFTLGYAYNRIKEE